MQACKTLSLIAVLAIAGTARAATHPHLFFGASDVAAMRTAASGSKRDIAGAILTTASAHLSDALPTTTTYADPRMHGNAVAVFAFAYVLSGDSRYAAKARSLLLRYESWDWTFGSTSGPDLNVAHMMAGVAVAYDWIYATLSSTDRASIAARLGKEAAALAADWSTQWWVDEYVQNHNWVDAGALGLAALALQGENASAPAWLGLAQSDLQTLAQTIGVISDGSWHEGVPYQAYGLSMALPFWQALAHDAADYTDMSFLRGLGRERLALAANDNPRIDVAPYGDFYGWSTDQTVQVLRFAAGRFHDGVAELAARRWLAAGHRTTDLPSLWYEVFEFLAFDPSVAPATITAQALDQPLPDLQAGVLRSSWNSDALTLTFKAGVFGGRTNFDRLKAGGSGHIAWGHDHNDDMSFWLYGAGWLAPEAAGYDAGTTSNYTYKANQTSYHNSILIDGNGMLGETRGTASSEVGYPWFFQRDAHTLERARGTAHYAIAGADGKALYASTVGLSRWDRLALLARDRYALIHDDLAASATHTYDWVCHFPDSASVDTASGWVEGFAHDGRVLGARIVAPASWAATTGSQTAQSLSKLEADSSIGYVRVHPTSARAAQKFLAVLVPMAATSWSARPSISALSSSEGLGAVVNMGTLQERWIFGTAGASSTASVAGGGLSLTGALVGLAGYVGGAGGTVERALLVGNGKLVDQSGARELLSTTNALMIEAEQTGATLAVTGSGIAQFRAYAPSATSVTLNGAPVAFTRSGSYVTYAAP